MWRRPGTRSAQDPGETVAKKKPADSNDPHPPDASLPKIPSQYKKDKQEPGDVATFKTDVDTVTLDVAVVDKNGHFIPGIPT